MDGDASSGSTEHLRGDHREDVVADGGSTENLRDLHALQSWLKGHSKSNAVKVVEAYLDLAINHFTKTRLGSIDSFREPWARIQSISRTKADPVGATGLSQFVKLRTLTSWFEARSEEYQQHCIASGTQPLRFVEHPGRPNRYGFVREDAQTAQDRPFVVADAVLRWRREIVPAEHLTALGRIIYPEGIFTYSGWRYWVIIVWTIVQVITFVSAAVLSLALLATTINGHPDLAITAFGLGAMSWAIYRFGMAPTMREADLRTSAARSGTTRRGGAAWVDRINVNLGRERDDPQYRHDAVPYRQLVRWKADCPICGAPVELKSESPISPGLVGCCVESPDEHSFTFDRVTLEGRPLRGRPIASS